MCVGICLQLDKSQFSRTHCAKDKFFPQTQHFLCNIQFCIFIRLLVHNHFSVAKAAELSGHPSCYSGRGDFYSAAFFHQLCKMYCSDCIWVFATEVIYTVYSYVVLLLS